jgi:hypothetical protein
MQTTFEQPDDFKPKLLTGNFLTFALPPTEEGEPQTVVEQVQRQDVTEEFTQKLDVSGWPRVGYIKERFVANDGSVVPPSSRVERVKRANGEIFFILWTPVPAEVDEDDVAAIALAVRDGLPIAGWNLSYHSWDGHWCECPTATYRNILGVGLFHEACGRVREHRIFGNDVPHLGMSDEEFNGFYPTIKGDDPAHWDPTKKGMDAWRGGPVMYGQPDADGVRYPVTGREIRGGRAEYREATKDYYEYDSGYFRDVDKIRARNKAERDATFELKQEIAEKQLPRKLGEV